MKKFGKKTFSNFFEIDTDKSLFDGLSFEDSRYQLIELIATEAERFHFLAESTNLTENDKARYHGLIALRNGQYAMEPGQLISSLWTLTQLLYKHYGQKAIILIDEYDVPLDKAFQHGYYKEMVALICGLFGCLVYHSAYPKKLIYRYHFLHLIPDMSLQ